MLKSLDYQIDDYRDKLENENINYELKNNIETQISNREYSKKSISEIEKDYSKAKEEYKKFCPSDKTIFDLYAGQKVKNSLVEFEVAIHKVFISGRSVGGDVNDPLKNIIDILRRNLINSMREDLGLY